MFDLGFENQTFEGLKCGIRVHGIWAIFDSRFEFQDFKDFNRVRGTQFNACLSIIKNVGNDDLVKNTFSVEIDCISALLLGPC